MKFKIGQVLNSKGWGIYGKLVRFRNKFVWGELGWGHSAIITKVNKDSVEIAEALNDGFKITDYEINWLQQKVKEGFYVVGETKIFLSNVRKLAKKYEGTPYSWFDVLAIVFGKFSKFGNTRAKKLICSEAVCRILYDASNKKINFEKEFDIDYDLIEPMHLWRSKQIKWLK